MSNGSIYRVENVNNIPTAVPYANIGNGDYQTQTHLVYGQDYSFSKKTNPFGTGEDVIGSYGFDSSSCGSIGHVSVVFDFLSSKLPLTISSGTYTLFEQDVISNEVLQQIVPFDSFYGFMILQGENGIITDAICEIRDSSGGGYHKASIRLRVMKQIKIVSGVTPRFEFMFINRFGL